MAQFEISGYRRTITPEGRKIVQIPVSTDTDSNATNPTAPSGMRLVSTEYALRPDGGRDYVFTYESSGSAPGDAQIQIAGQAAQEPIETHPKFNGEGDGGGNVSDGDLASIKASLNSGQAPTLTGSGPDLQAAEDLYNLMLKGVTHYFTPSGITYSETFDETIKPNLTELCSIDRPPPDAPTVRQGSNWLLIGIRAQKVYEPDSGTSFWRVTREWLCSGPRGWNADFDIYS
jgi:hypothetical protein